VCVPPARERENDELKCGRGDVQSGAVASERTRESKCGGGDVQTSLCAEGGREGGRGREIKSPSVEEETCRQALL
jgi:hypothetical protein